MSGKSRMKIKRPEKVVPLCLDASLQADWEQADKALNDVNRGVTDDRMVGGATRVQQAEKVQAIEKRMLAHTVHFHLGALPRHEWNRVAAEHPPREGNAQDRQYGVNTDTFFDAVMAAADATGAPLTIRAVKKGGRSVPFDVDEWADLADDMTSGQYALFVDAILELNRGQVSVPFSRAASSILRHSSGTSA